MSLSAGLARECASQQIRESGRLWALARRERLERSNKAAIDVLLNGGSAEEAHKAFKVGFGPLAFFLLGIAWDIFWHWWTNRNK